MTRNPIAALVLALLVGAVPLLLVGCQNDCQKLCKEMASYWDDCGVSYNDSEVADCRKDFRDKDLREKYDTSCRQLVRPMEADDGTMQIGLRARFTCEDMEAGPGGAFAR